jgi:hypothetical protein
VRGCTGVTPADLKAQLTHLFPRSPSGSQVDDVRIVSKADVRVKKSSGAFGLAADILPQNHRVPSTG